jgi:cytochrome c peroxidase
MRRILATSCAAALLIACSGDDAVTPEPVSDGGTKDVAPDTVTPPDAAADVGADAGEFTPAEVAILNTLTPLGQKPPADTTNTFADNANAAKLGQMLFFDKSYSGALVVGNDGSNGGLGTAGDTGKVACASCHGGANSTGGLHDDRSKPGNVSLGVDFGTRNALALIDSSYEPWTNWGGRFDSQWSLPLAVAENGVIMKSGRLQIAHLLWTKYKTEYNAIFPVPLDASLDPADVNASRFPAAGNSTSAAWLGMTGPDQLIVNRIFANYGKAIQAYLRLLVSRNAPFDKYVAGDSTALDDAQKRGLHAFIGKAGCVSCHSGPALTDGKFHALAVPQTGAHVPAVDLGRFQDVPPLLASIFNTSGVYSDDVNTGKLTGVVQTPSMTGQFRTPTLRGVAKTAPYMHSGQLATLADVISYYNAGGNDPGDSGVTKDPLLKPLSLQSTESADLAKFLEALSGDPVPASLLMDTSK